MNPAYILLGADSQELKALATSLLEGQEISWDGADRGADKTAVWIFPGDARDQLQEAPALLRSEGWELAKIIALVDVESLQTHPEYTAWATMLAHFADVLLFKNSKLIGQGEFKAWQKKFGDRPMLIKRWPEDSREAADIIFPEARRLTQHFEVDTTGADDWKAGALFIEDCVDEDEDDEAAAHGHKHKKPKVNGHAPKKKNVNQANLEDLEPFAAESYFTRDAANRYLTKIKAPEQIKGSAL